MNVNDNRIKNDGLNDRWPPKPADSTGHNNNSLISSLSATATKALTSPDFMPQAIVLRIGATMKICKYVFDALLVAVFVFCFCFDLVVLLFSLSLMLTR